MRIVVASPARPAALAIPKIRLLSWLGAETVAWGLVIAHLVKWSFSWAYFASWQVKYPGPLYGALHPYLLWYGKDDWDRLVVHIQNGLPGEVAVLCGVAWAIISLVSILAAGRQRLTHLGVVATVAGALAAGALAGYGTAGALAGWHVHWFATQQSPAWWLTGRHRIRDVGIPLVGTVAVRMIFAKPKFGPDDNPGLRAYVTRIPLAFAAALIPIAAVAVIAWQLPWLEQHGVEIPARYGAWAAAVNEWLSAGLWIDAVMGIAGGIVAGIIVQRVADDVQWFFAERSAGKLERHGFLSTGKVWGTPSHRKRVRYLLAAKPNLPERSPWLERFLVFGAFLVLASAGAGAWLNLVGPAAH